MSSIDHLIQPAFAAIPGGMVPFETLERTSSRLGLPVERLAKLDANENVYGPSPKTIATLAGYAQWNLYPDASQLVARQALARYTGVDQAHLMLTNGGDELIGMLCHLLLSPGDNIVECSPSFEMYAWYVRAFNGELRSALRDPENEYRVSPRDILAQVDRRTKMILLCNPNNPTGTLMPLDQVVSLLDAGVVVMVDEAYYEFSGLTVAPLVSRYDNLVVLRTMSKWAALAGLRVGYAVASLAIMEHLPKLKDPFNVNLAGLVATVASVEDAPYLLANVRKIIAERERLYQALREIPFLRVYPSRGNFILCRVMRGDARQIRGELEKQGLLLRFFDKPSLPNALRCTVGKPEHTDRLVAALREMAS
jgi:histidinol-phosphate aminotransferase